MKIIHDVNPEEERKLQELAAAANKLHLPFIGAAYFQLELLDKEDNIISIYRDRSHSWTRNGYNSFAQQLFAIDGEDPFDGYTDGNLGRKHTSGTALETIYPGFTYVAAAGNTNFGTIIGTSDTAESFDDYKVLAPIAHGTGAVQMEYGVVTKTATWQAGVLRFKAEYARNIVNNSAGAITVKELGIYMHPINYQGNDVNIFYGCMARDVLASPVTVDPTYQLRTKYNLYGPAFPA